MRVRDFVAGAVIALIALAPFACKENRVPEKPNISGPVSGSYGETLDFTVSSTDPDKDDVSYFVEWGDGKTMDWTAEATSGTIITLSHVFAESGAYQSKVKARDPKGLESEWSDPRDIAIKYAIPFAPQTPQGPGSAEQGVACTLTTRVHSPSRESVYIRFAWGDGDTSAWSSPVLSDSVYRAVRVYASVGTFLITAQAKHASGASSNWSGAETIAIGVGRPAVPGAPEGPDSTFKGAEVEYRVSTTSAGGNVRYVLDWGDTRVETTASTAPSPETVSVIHTWTAAGDFVVTAMAMLTSNPGKASDWSVPRTVRVLPNQVPAVPQFQAPPFAVPGVFALFTATTTDPDGDRVSFQFHYGDTVGTWTVLVQSGAVATDSHNYAQAGTVYVKCRARDEKGTMSSWSDSTQVVVEAAGQPNWTPWRNPDGRQPITSPVIVSEGGEEWIYTACDGGSRIYAVGPDGGTRAEGFVLDGVFTGHPAYCEETGHIIAGNNAGLLCAFGRTLGQAVWRYPNMPDLVSWGTPVVRSNRIYVSRGEESLCAFLDLGTSATLRRTVAVAGGIPDAPVLDLDGNVVFGTGDGRLVKMDDSLSGVIWSVRLEGSGRIHTPAIGSDGTIYAGAELGHLFAVASDSTRRWSRDLGAEVWRPVVGASLVFVGTSTGKLYAVDPSNGSTSWEWQADQSRTLASAPVLTSGGYLYCQDTSDVLYCLTQAAPPQVIMKANCRAFLSGGGNPTPDWYAPSLTLDSQGNVVVVGKHALYSITGLSGQTLATVPWPKWQHDRYNTGNSGSILARLRGWR